MKGIIFDIKRDCSEDGPGIRTTVFFKGCPLRCAWCHNPEGIEHRPSVVPRSGVCAPGECGTLCVAACEWHALSASPKGLEIQQTRCNGCGRCLAACTRDALALAGEWLTAKELAQRLLVDRPFFDCTGGGVTLSGGEPTLQMEFAGQLLRLLRSEGIGTAIETCGAFNFARFERLLLPFVDHIYFDLKLMDDRAHRHWTGISNRGILANLARLKRMARDRLRVRVPLIPGVTATGENLDAMRDHLRKMGIDTVELLPWNPLGLGKGVRIGAAPLMEANGFMTAEQERAAARWFTAPPQAGPLR